MKALGPIKKLGTQWWFEFFDLPKGLDLEALSVELYEFMEVFENKYSRFRDTSELSQLNETKIWKDPSVEFLELFRIAFRAYRETNGLFNIAVGSYLEKSGYNRDYSFQSDAVLPEVPNLDEVLHVGTDQVILTKNARVDFGGFGKGYLIDLIAMFFKKKGIKYFLINGGGDIYVTSDKGDPVQIYLQDPINRDVAAGAIYAKDQGFAASSPYLRSWSSNGKLFTHLVSKNGQEPKGVFVLASTAVWADIWATTLAVDSDIVPPKEIEFIRV